MKLNKWDRVRHPRFGDGIVCCQTYDGTWTTVAFIDEREFWQVETDTLRLIKTECQNETAEENA